MSFIKPRGVTSFMVLSLTAFATTNAYAQKQAASATKADAAALKTDVAKLVGSGASYLAGSQAEDGSWSSFAGTGITSLAGTGLLRNGRTASDPVVAKAIEFVLSNVKPDGGIYLQGSLYRNYETCLAIMMLSEVNADGKHNKVIGGAEKFITTLQWDEAEGHGPESLNYGGAGYGKHGRPDMSNTGFFLEAKRALGRDASDPSVEKALTFIARCQNLETEHNPTEWAAKIGDGGFYYTCAAGGQSQAGETPAGGLRSYGSMTYVGLKSLLYAGVDAKDKRVKAAREWIGKNYTLDRNPGMGQQGLYYYYHVFAKALDTVGDPQVADPQGTQHNWRADLVTQLAKRQNKDGSWTNPTERWLESDPNLVTAYVLLALSHSK